MKTRILQFLSAENITQSEFARNIGVSSPNVTHVINGRNKPSCDFIISIARRYPTLNLDWLLMGTGKMYKEQENFNAYNTAKSSVDEPVSENLYDPENLFDMAQFEQTAPSEPSQQPAWGMTEANDTREEINNSKESIIDSISLDKNKQHVNNQRKAVRVTIFYNDGSFQDL